ncbi:glycosyltransferase family 8 protein [Spiribacter insolitus]|uniref:Glycosyltransferase family 8 protein n=1 Tax=Spiribacter insolitus TaxID=3122417 RepID=A0ABV3T813_9GAMM
MTDKKIHIAAATDSNYAQHICVLSTSVLCNSKDPGNIFFHILDCGIKKAEKNLIADNIRGFSGNVYFLEVDAHQLSALPNTRHTKASYARLFAPDLLPREISRLIYLDSDIIVLDDVSGLYTFPLDGKIIAAARDFSTSSGERLGLGHGNYFNSGVLLLDLNQWRERSLSDVIKGHLIEAPSAFHFADQDALNITFSSSWKELPPRWNTQLGVYNSRREKWAGLGFKKDDLAAALRNPAIVHYINNSKPWLYKSTHPLKSLYWHYLQMTPFRDYRYPDKNIRTMIKKSIDLKRIAKGIRCRRAFAGRI